MFVFSYAAHHPPWGGFESGRGKHWCLRTDKIREEFKSRAASFIISIPSSAPSPRYFDKEYIGIRRPFVPFHLISSQLIACHSIPDLGWQSESFTCAHGRWVVNWRQEKLRPSTTHLQMKLKNGRSDRVRQETRWHVWQAGRQTVGKKAEG